MVKKHCKYGLNTGNTLRRTDHVTARTKYEYMSLQPVQISDYLYHSYDSESDEEEYQYQDLYGKKGQKKLAKNYPKLYQALGKTGEGVEYSVSKKKRWMLQSQHLDDIESDVYPAEHKADLVVHEQNIKLMRRYYEEEHLRKGVTEYYTNHGPVREKQSSTHTQSLQSIMLPENRPPLKKGINYWDRPMERRKRDYKYLSGTKTWMQLHVFEKCPLTSKVLSNRGHSKASYNHADYRYRLVEEEYCDWGKWWYDEWLNHLLRREKYRNSVKHCPADLSEITDYLNGDSPLTHELLTDEILSDEPLTADFEDELLKPRTEFPLEDFVRPSKSKRIRHKRCRRRQPLLHSHKDKKVSLNEPIISVLTSDNTDVTDSTKTNPIENPTISVPSIEFTPLPHSVLITLKTKSQSGASGYKELKRAYREDYQEAYTTPRLFNIRLFEHVYLIFHQLCEDSHQFRIHLTGDLNDDNLKSYINIENNNTYVTEIKHLVKRLRRKLPHKAVTSSHSNNSSVSKKSWKEPAIYLNLNKWSTTSEKFTSYTEEHMSTLISHSEMNLKNQKSVEDEYLVIPNWYQRSKSMITECGICFEALSASTAHISLQPCKHLFCTDCWSNHIQSQMGEGLTDVKCPEYKCMAEITPIVIRSFVCYELYKKWMHRSADKNLQRDDLKTYCSNKKCDLILGVKSVQSSKEPIFLSCECRTYKCMGCDQEPHWPIPCKLLENYHQCLQADGLLSWKDLASSQLITDKFVRCPRCRTPIERIEGCPHMHCSRCETDFCWNCGGLYDSHDWSTDCTKNDLGERYVGDGENIFYKTAVKHRYMSVVNKESSEVLTRTRSIVKTITMSTYKKLREAGEQIQSVTENIEQVVRFCFHLHRLLENLYAFNFTNDSSVLICYNELSALEFLLERIEGLFKLKITQRNYDGIMRYFEKMKSLTNSVMETYSRVYYPPAVRV